MVVLGTFLAWDIESQVLKKNLFKGELKNIPNEFQSIEEWESIYHHHLLEDIRASIAHHLQFPENLVETDCDLFRIEFDPSESFKKYRLSRLILKNLNNVKAQEKEKNNFNDDEDSLEEADEDKFARSLIGIITFQKRKEDGKFDSFNESYLVKVLVVQSNNAIWISHACGRAIIENPDKEWKLYVFPEASLTPSERISVALESFKENDFRSSKLITEILTLKVQGQILLDDEIKQKTNNLDRNENQNLAINKVLTSIDPENRNSMPSIQLIQGPPGTGKSTTIIDIVFHLLNEKKAVCATAPTNFAICEVAKRAYLEAVKHEYPIRKIVLYGNKQRLKLNEELDNILLEKRINRLEKAAKSWAQNRSELMDVFTGHLTVSDIEKENLINNCINDIEIITKECPTSLLSDVQLELNQKIISLLKSSNNTKMLIDCLSYFDSTPLMNRRTLKEEILQNADLLLCTVSSVSALKYYGNINYFDRFKYIIVDEATQLLGVATSILVSNELECLVLVGDDKQLPATVISEENRRLGYGMSLFESLIKHKYPSTMLKIQYRMHPKISSWPSNKFYQSQLVDGINEVEYTKPWHEEIPPLSFFQVDGEYEESDHTGSKFNPQETIITIKLVRYFIELLKKYYNNGDSITKFSLGIISPYAAQVRLIQEEIDCIYFPPFLSVVCSSVDGFQGKECDVVIFSSVRSGSILGFVSDLKRFNVAITRAKYSLIIIGNETTLSRDDNFRGFLEYAKQFSRLNCTLLEESHNKLINRLNQNSNLDIWSGNSKLFDNLPWTKNIIFTDNFKKEFTKQNDEIRKQVISYLLKLIRGKWFKSDQRNTLLFDESIAEILFVHPFSSFNLIWRVDIKLIIDDRQTTWSQIIKVIHLCTDASTEAIISREGEIIKRLHPIQINFCKEKVINDFKVIPILKRIIDDSDLIIISQDKNKFDSLVIEEGECEAPEKTYALSQDVASRLLQAKEGENIQLLFNVSDDENQLIHGKGPQFILGRSGTGKTTVMLYRMINNEKLVKSEISRGQIEGEDITQLLDYRQLLVTASPVLAIAIRENYLKLSMDNRSDSLLTINPTDMTIFQSTKTYNRLDNTNVHEYPMITTFDSLIRMIDLCLPEPFQNNSKGVQINFKQFQNIAPEDKQFNSYVLYKEFISVIKGEVKHLDDKSSIKKKFMTLEDYISFSKRRGNNYSEEESKHIYSLFEIYQKVKGNDYDIGDFTSYVYNSLSQGNHIKMRFQAVFIDEVQDLTMKQIAILKFCCSEHDGFFFAGDTAQTIAQGVGFRFESLKDLFFKEYIPYFKKITLGEMKVPEIKQLKRNYRTHSQILKLANTIIKLILHFFPESMDKVEDETSYNAGPQPIFLSDTDNLISKMFQGGVNNKNCEFGSDQVILVRDVETQNTVKNICGSNALVLTVYECKGMEFSDILIYDFFSSSQMGEKWRVIANSFQNVFNIEDSKIPPRRFDEKLHLALCQELKMLYVLITRAKRNVFIFEKDRKVRYPFLFLWNHNNVKAIKVEAYTEKIEKILMPQSNPEEWCQRGNEFFQRQDYKNALLCYGRGKDNYHKELCRAMLAVIEGDALISTIPTDACKCYMDAALIYESDLVAYLTEKQDDERRGYLKIAAELYLKANSFDKAGALYFQISLFSEATESYLKAEKWSKAAQVYALCDKILEALNCYYKDHNYSEALEVLDNKLGLNTLPMSSPSANSELDELPEEKQGSNQKELSFLHDLRQECIIQGADYHLSRGELKDMIAFVHKMSLIDEQRKYLIRRKCFSLLLDIESKEKNYVNIAFLNLQQGQYLEASEVYKQKNNFLDYVKYQLKDFRLRNIDSTQHPVLLNTISDDNSTIKAYLQELLQVDYMIKDEQSEVIGDLQKEINFWLHDLDDYSNIQTFFNKIKEDKKNYNKFLQGIWFENYPLSLRIRLPWLIIRQLLSTYKSSDSSIPWKFINSIVTLFEEQIINKLLQLIQKLINPLPSILTDEEINYFEQLNDLFGLRINTREKSPIVSIECNENAINIQNLWGKMLLSHDKTYITDNQTNETIDGLTLKYALNIIRKELKAIRSGYHQILFNKAETEGQILLNNRYNQYLDEINTKNNINQITFWSNKSIQLVEYLLSREQDFEKELFKLEKYPQENKITLENCRNKNKFIKELKVLITEETFSPIYLKMSELQFIHQMTLLTSIHRRFYEQLLSLQNIIQSFVRPKQDRRHKKRLLYDFDKYAKDMLILDHISDERSEWILQSLLNINDVNKFLLCLWSGKKKELDAFKTGFKTDILNSIQNIIEGRLLIAMFLHNDMKKEDSPCYYGIGMMSPFIYLQWMEQTIIIFILLIQGNQKRIYLMGSMFIEYFQRSPRLKKIIGQIIQYFRLKNSKIAKNQLEKIKNILGYLFNDLRILLQSPSAEIKKWFGTSVQKNSTGRASHCKNSNEIIACFYLRIINLFFIYNLSTGEYKYKLKEILSSLDPDITRCLPKVYANYINLVVHTPSNFGELCESINDKLYELCINKKNVSKLISPVIQKYILYPCVIEEANSDYLVGEVNIHLYSMEEYTNWEAAHSQIPSTLSTVEVQDVDGEINIEEDQEELEVQIEEIFPAFLQEKIVQWVKRARERCKLMKDENKENQKIRETTLEEKFKYNIQRLLHQSMFTSNLKSVKIYLQDIYPSYYLLITKYYSYIETLSTQTNKYNQLLTEARLIDEVSTVLESYNPWITKLSPNQLLDRAKDLAVVDKETIKSISFPSEILNFCENDLPYKLIKLDNLYEKVQTLIQTEEKKKQREIKNKGNVIKNIPQVISTTTASQMKTNNNFSSQAISNNTPNNTNKIPNDTTRSTKPSNTLIAHNLVENTNILIASKSMKSNTSINNTNNINNTNQKSATTKDNIKNSSPTKTLIHGKETPKEEVLLKRDILPAGNPHIEFKGDKLDNEKYQIQQDNFEDDSDDVDSETTHLSEDKKKKYKKKKKRNNKKKKKISNQTMPVSSSPDEIEAIRQLDQGRPSIPPSPYIMGILQSQLLIYKNPKQIIHEMKSPKAMHYLSLLQHATYCEKCASQECFNMKSFILQTKQEMRLFKKPPGNQLFYFHAINCNVPNCKVLGCENFKKREY